MLPAGFSLDSEGSRCGLPRDGGKESRGKNRAVWEQQQRVEGTPAGCWSCSGVVGRPPSATARNGSKKPKPHSEAPRRRQGPGGSSLSGLSLSSDGVREVSQVPQELKKKHVRIRPQRSTQSRKEVSNEHAEQDHKIKSNHVVVQPRVRGQQKALSLWWEEACRLQAGLMAPGWDL